MAKKKKIYPEYELPLVSDSSQVSPYTRGKNGSRVHGTKMILADILSAHQAVIIITKPTLVSWNCGPSSQVFEYGIQN